VALVVTGLSFTGVAAATAAPAVSTSTSSAVTTATTREAPGKDDLQRSAKLRRQVSADSVMAHLRRFEDLAKANGGNRAAGAPGYETTAAYVEKELKNAGYKPTRQYFEFRFEQVTRTSLTQVSPQQRSVEQNPMSYSPGTPAGGITADLVVPAVATGCDAAAWQGVQATGKIALVQRGTCSFAVKSQMAKAAGASAAIIYNNTDGALSGTLGGPAPDYVPTTGITKADGESLLAATKAGPVRMTFVLDKIMEQRKTFNIIAETPWGSSDNVVMVGAHLDSVTGGPGINDNGSGSAAILEVARELNKQSNIQGNLKRMPNKVRFAWWGAEEIGLLGSTHYVNDLVATKPDQLKKIATYLNFDMVGSPNYIIGVYDADQSTYKAPVPVPPGSVATEKVFTDYFHAVKQPWVDTEFSGRSDYQAFIVNGVPASGLFTGADGKKSAEDKALFGGTVGETYDPNYHTPQDDLTNIDKRALEINSDAIAHAVLTLATSTKAVNGRS